MYVIHPYFSIPIVCVFMFFGVALTEAFYPWSTTPLHNWIIFHALGATAVIILTGCFGALIGALAHVTRLITAARFQRRLKAILGGPQPVMGSRVEQFLKLFGYRTYLVGGYLMADAPKDTKDDRTILPGRWTAIPVARLPLLDEEIHGATYRTARQRIAREPRHPDAKNLLRPVRRRALPFLRTAAPAAE